MNRLPPLNWLRAFDISAQHLSFTRAAYELNLTQSAVSQQVRSLESYFGQKLFHRLPRGLALTEAGKALHPGVYYAVDSLARATHVLLGSPNYESVAISSTISFATLCLAPKLLSFRQMHPEIEIQIDTAVWADSDLETPDLAVRVGDGNWPGMRSSKITTDELVVVCAPSLLQESASFSEETLLKQTFINIRGERLGWHDWFAESAERKPPNISGIWANNSLLALELAANGCGIALVRSVFAAQYLETNRLIVPFERRLQLFDGHYLLTSEEGPRRDKVEVFWQWMVEQFADA